MMKFLALVKETVRDFKFFHHDMDQLSSARELRYVRPFILFSCITVCTFAAICEEFPKVSVEYDKIKYAYLDLEK